MSANSPKIRLAILDDYQNVALTSADWSAILPFLDITSFPDTLTEADEDALVERLYDFEIVCAMRERTKFGKSVLERLPNLRLIATTGPYNRGIDVAYAKSKGIIVCGTLGAGNATLEHIWALILATTRHITEEDGNIRNQRPLREWQTVVPTGLAGKTLGIIGLGRLGAQVAKIAQAFDMKVLAWSPHLTPQRAASVNPDIIYSPSKAHLLANSDIVTLQLVLSPSTHHILSSADLALLKPTSYLINTSRGGLIEEHALIQILKDRKIRGAGLDVYEVEPLPLDHPLRILDNVTLSPHNGYVSDDNYRVFWGETVRNIQAYLEGRTGRLLMEV